MNVAFSLFVAFMCGASAAWLLSSMFWDRLYKRLDQLCDLAIRKYGDVVCKLNLAREANEVQSRIIANQRELIARLEDKLKSMDSTDNLLNGGENEQED